MNITRENIDALNAVVKVDINAADYQEKVATTLKNYRKQANIPGFRKGHVPMGLIKNQYEKSIIVDEVNKLLQEAINNFLVEEKLDILGNPLPKENKNFDWDAENLSFEFELGLTPEVTINLENVDVTKYNIVADEELLNKEVANLQNRYGKLVAQAEVTENSTIRGEFINEEEAINNKAFFTLEDIKDKTNANKFIGAKVGDVIELKSKSLFNEDYKLSASLGLKAEEVKDLDIDLTFTISEISYTEPAELDQELFDKLFGEGVVTSVSELKDKIKEDAEKQFAQQADQHLLNAVADYLVENTSFDLPKEFLIKWLGTAGQKELSNEEAVAEYEKSERGLRYQLIESKILADNNIKVEYNDLKEHTIEFIKQQMAQFGQLNPEQKELEDIALRVLNNQKEAQRLQTQLIGAKILEFYKNNVKFNEKEVSYEAFIAEVYN